MKKLMTIAMLAIGVTATAENYKYVTVDCNGAEQSILLESIRKITFENGQIVVNTSEGSQTFLQSETNKMFFSDMETAVTGIATDRKQATAIYDLCGRKVLPAAGQISRLKGGIYIIDGKKIFIK